jgi:hypothetical protein
VQQPRILIVDSEGSSGLPYAKLSARLQPFEVRVERSLDAAVATLFAAEHRHGAGLPAGRRGRLSRPRPC